MQLVLALALAAAPASANPAAQHGGVLASLQRTACYGTCPIYKVTVYADGSVHWHGVRFVKVVGERSGHATPGELKALREAFRAAHFLKRPDIFNCREVTDNPSAILFYREGTRAKTLDHYLGCRRPKGVKALTRLEGQVDAILHTARWVGKRR